MAEAEWVTAVGRVGPDGVRVRGYALDQIIRNLSFPEAVYLTIRGELPDQSTARVLNAALCGILEHGLYAPAAVVVRTVASTMPTNIMPAIGSAIGTMGPIAGSPEHAGRLIQEMVHRVETTGCTSDEAADWCVEGLLSSGTRMPGVGHALYPDGDLRARAILDVLQSEDMASERTRMFLRARDTFAEMKARALPLNVDGAMACALSEIGFRPAEMAGIAGMSFLPGLIAHACEEASEGPRLRIANARYEGPEDRDLPS